MANRNFANGGRRMAMHVQMVDIDLNFQVDNTQQRGISNLKGPLVQAVYMNSAHATPSKVVAAGTIVVQLQNGYNGLFNVKKASIQSPNSGSDVKIDNSAMTPGVAYVITTLGNATAAKWRSIGVPAGVEPAVGVAFIASNNGGAGDTLTSRVQATAAAGSGVASIEVVGITNQSIAPDPSANQGFGSQIILQCRDYAGAIVAPAAGSVIYLDISLSNSSVQIGGE